MNMLPEKNHESTNFFVNLGEIIRIRTTEASFIFKVFVESKIFIFIVQFLILSSLLYT